MTGLANGTAYTFTVTATNAVGTGAASAASNAVTPATVPGAPTIGTATAGNAQASVAFTPPASNGGAAITGYTATSSPGGLTGTCVSSPCTVTGLANGTAYTFTVTAANAAGTGPASGASNAVTPAVGYSPYTPDANTVLLDHLDGATSASILAYSNNGQACGAGLPSATPNSAYVTGPSGLSQALSMSPPAGQPAGSATYLRYAGGQLLSQANGTIEFWTYFSSYGTGVPLVDQGPFYGSCAGWTFGMGVNATGQLQAGAWAAFTMNSGANTVPLNTWTHVAATWGSAGAKLYINGVQVGSDANTGMPASGYGGSVLIRAGTQTGANGRIDELRISNVQRTSFGGGL